MKDELFELVCEHFARTCPSCTACTTACAACTTACTTACIPRGTSAPTTGVTQVLAAQTLKIANIDGLAEGRKLETEIEDDIQWEERAPPKEVIGRARHKIESILHCRKMLLVIVVLNIIDCLLVVAELTLDFNAVTNHFVATTDHNDHFLRKLKVYNAPFLADLPDVEDDNLTQLFDRLLQSYIVWNITHMSYSGPNLAADCVPIQDSYDTQSSGSGSNVLTRLLLFTNEASKQPVHMEPLDLEHRKQEEVGHILHYFSISILSFLLLETILKVACVGTRIFKKKMEMFDATVIVVSFILDLIFTGGLTSHNLKRFVIILSFLLPWRIIRVLNSLIVALLNKHRFHLKLLYKQKRKITKQYQDASETMKSVQKQVEALKGLCSNKGVHEWEVHKAIAQSVQPNAQGGLKALGSLVFRAAESFAPFHHRDHSKKGHGSPERTNSQPNDHFERSTSSPNGDTQAYTEEVDIEVDVDLDSDEAEEFTNKYRPRSPAKRKHRGDSGSPRKKDARSPKHSPPSDKGERRQSSGDTPDKTSPKRRSMTQSTGSLQCPRADPEDIDIPREEEGRGPRRNSKTTIV